MRNFSFMCHVGAEIHKMGSPEPPLGVTVGVENGAVGFAG